MQENAALQLLGGGGGKASLVASDGEGGWGDGSVQATQGPGFDSPTHM